MPISGSAAIYTTIDSDEDIEKGIANWNIWHNTFVTDNSFDILESPVNAFKVFTNGVCSLSLVGGLRNGV